MPDTNLPQTDDYDEYFERRGWDEAIHPESLWYYDKVMNFIKFSAGMKVLEIGFGNSAFLEWCRTRGLQPAGVEILDASLKKAQSLGHEVFKGPLNATTLEPDRKFDLIIAFDVIEHLTVNEIRTFLADTVPHLNPNGRYLFRFPNGNSPFSAPMQTGDITHQTVVSAGLMKDIAKRVGLRVELVFNDRFLPPGMMLRLRRSLSFGLRSMIELIIGFAYYGGPIPLDPNVFVVLSRATIR